AIESILAAAGNVPLGLKRDKLRNDLNQIRSMLAGFPSLPPSHELRKRLQQRLKVARRERDLLSPRGSPDPLDLHIQRLEEIDRGGIAVRSADGSRIVSTEVLRNPCRSLAGTILPILYEDHFKRRGGVSRQPHGDAKHTH